MAEDWITASVAAGRLGVSEARIRQLILEGALPAQKFGRVQMVRARDLDRIERPPMVRLPNLKATKPAKKKA